MMDANDSEFQQRMSHVEQLVDQIEALPDPTARELSRRLTQSLLDLHEAGFRRMLELVSEGDDKSGVPTPWQQDPLVSNLLILHQLHPLSVESRVAKAISQMQPLLKKHQMVVEIQDLSDQHVHLQLSGGCGGCGSVQQTIREELDAAICASAPELQVTISGLDATTSKNDSMLPILGAGSSAR